MVSGKYGVLFECHLREWNWWGTCLCCFLFGPIAMLLFPLNEFYHAIQVGNCFLAFWAHVFRKTRCLSNGLGYETRAFILFWIHLFQYCSLCCSYFCFCLGKYNTTKAETEQLQQQKRRKQEDEAPHLARLCVGQLALWCTSQIDQTWMRLIQIASLDHPCWE